tara:strand:- start:162 stop:659 length:498 start_codon:yes stop_codon:yes gene_type:complete
VTINKFSKIAFPFFGLLVKPYEVNITFDKIQIRRKRFSQLETLDDKALAGDYFARLMQLDKRGDFNVTCKNIQDCLVSKVVWGLDKNAIIHDLTKRNTFKAANRKILKVKNNLVWLDKIAYPFKVNTDQTLHIDDILYGRVIYINNEWFLKEFTMEPKTRNYERF